MKEEQKIEHLKNIELFDSLNYEELRQITGIMVIKNFRKNEVILHEEDTNEFMYIILEGEVKVIRTMEEGKEIRLAIHRSGDFFGELSLIDGKTVPATVLATKDSVTAIVSKREFYSLLFSQNKVLQNLLRILCSRYRESLKLIQMLNFNNASQRVKMLFIMLSNKYGRKEGQDVVLDIKLTHQDIAEMTGMTRETVTRVIDKWQKDKDISIKNKMIRLNQKFCEISNTERI